MPSGVFNQHKYNSQIGTYNLEAVGDFKMMIVTSSYTPNADHDTVADVSGEITNGNYTAGGFTLTNVSVTRDDANDRAVVDADDYTYAALGAGDTPAYGILYHVPTLSLVSWHEITGDVPNGTDYVVRISANGLIRVS